MRSRGRRGSLAAAFWVGVLALGTAGLSVVHDPASAADGDRWVLFEVRANPNDAKTEFVNGVDPEYYEYPRFDGSFVRYTVTTGRIGSHLRTVDRGFQYVDMTTETVFSAPPGALYPGEEITLNASGTASGTTDGGAVGGEQFEFRAEGITLEGETYFAIGIGAPERVASASVSPTFVVPDPWGPDAEIVINAFYWNCSACLVQYVYHAEIAATTTTAGPATTTTTPTATTLPDEPLSCFVEGNVRDAGARPGGAADDPGHPLIDTRVALWVAGTEVAWAPTDRNGDYSIEVAEDMLPAGTDVSAALAYVELRLVDAAHDPSRFAVLAAGNQTALDSDDFVLADECAGGGLVVRDFHLAAIPDDYVALAPRVERWGDVGEIYDRVRRATQLADLLGQRIDYGPLLVNSFATGSWDELGPVRDRAAMWCGAVTAGVGCKNVVIMFGDSTSLLTDGGWPDNRDYHEFGHHFLADSFADTMPRYPGDKNHAGYYANASSTDSWTEGFAEFFSMMVSKHIDGDSQPERYRVSQTWALDLELDYRPWLGRGKYEELAVAGLLLDLEDGPSDYAAGRERPDLAIAWHDVYGDPALGQVLVGEARFDGDPPEYSEQTTVAAEFRRDGEVVFTGWAITQPWDLRFRGGTGFFAIVIPPGTTWDRVDLAAFEGRPGDVGTDDDPVDLELQELWDTIVRYTSLESNGNAHLFDVADLHAAIRAEFGGRDVDGNGIDDIDQVFIAHGLYADPDGDRSYQGEQPGMTDHPALGSYPDRIPRRDLEPLPATMMTVDAGVPDAQVVVQVVPATGTPYSYLATPDAEGRVHVAVPPDDGSVLLGVVAPDHEPALAGTVDALQFWADVDTDGDTAAPSFNVTLTRESGGGTSLWLILAATGGLLALLTGGAIWWRLKR